MSGHSKWSQIKRAKGAADNARGKLFTKIGKEIHIAVKAGGTDPNANARLRDMIAKARSNNMPNDNIARCIKKASGEGASTNYEFMLYEGYGTGGVAVIVEALTDNKNRTAGEVRSAFEKHGGSLGVSGSVSFMFERCGVINVAETVGEDKLLETLLDASVKDIQNDGDVLQVTCEATDLGKICAILENAAIKTESAQVEWVANNYIALPDEKQTAFTKMLDMLEDSDDVQNVFHNAE